MSEHRVKVKWSRLTTDFNYDSYDRTHDIEFEGGLQLRGSSAPQYMGKKELANPEEMLAAALSSCHMLTFLAVSARSRLVVDSYEDNAVATLGKMPSGKMGVTKITLRPKVSFGEGSVVDAKKLADLHEKAHANCFIGNSLSCEFALENA